MTGFSIYTRKRKNGKAVFYACFKNQMEATPQQYPQDAPRKGTQKQARGTPGDPIKKRNDRIP